MFRKNDIEYQFQKRNFELIAYLNSKMTLDEKILEFFIENEKQFYKTISENKELKSRLSKDSKTGLLTYRETHFRDALISYHNQNSSEDLINISLIRFDLDNFSLINSGFGHAFGDAVLNKFAEILVSNSRPEDLLIRYGGEEFDVFIINSERVGAENFTKRVINITENTLIHHNRKPVKITVSAGIASKNIKVANYVRKISAIDSLNEILQIQADNALYEAKFNGKNRFSIYTDNKLELYSEIRKSYKRCISAVNE